jgi:hypothetical protein
MSTDDKDKLAKRFLALQVKTNALRREVDDYVDAIGDDNEYIRRVIGQAARIPGGSEHDIALRFTALLEEARWMGILTDRPAGIFDIEVPLSATFSSSSAFAQ